MTTSHCTAAVHDSSCNIVSPGVHHPPDSGTASMQLSAVAPTIMQTGTWEGACMLLTYKVLCRTAEHWTAPKRDKHTCEAYASSNTPCAGRRIWQLHTAIEAHSTACTHGMRCLPAGIPAARSVCVCSPHTLQTPDLPRYSATADHQAPCAMQLACRMVNKQGM
jgi:hypothetical protein